MTKPTQDKETLREGAALAQAVAAAGRRMQDYAIMAEENVLRQSIEAHARAIEQHEAFRQEVSDAVEKHLCTTASSIQIADVTRENLARFIIPKPDPLVEAMQEACGAQGLATKHTPGELTEHLRAAIEKRGGRIIFDGSGA